MKIIINISIVTLISIGLIGAYLRQPAKVIESTRLPTSKSVNDFMKNLTGFGKQYENHRSTGAYVIHMKDFSMVKKLSYSKITYGYVTKKATQRTHTENCN